MAVILPVLLMALTLVSYTDAAIDIYYEISVMKTQLDLLTKHIYFRATFKGDQSSCVGGTTVVFDLVVANTGNAYSSTTGIFTAPQRGNYVFAYQTFPIGSADVNWDLYINDNMALRARSKTSGDTSNLSLLPVTLQAGDRVYVKSGGDLKFWAQTHSFFTGWLLKAF